MASANYYYVSTPIIGGGSATIVLYSETTDDPPVVLLADEPGDEHQVNADPNGATPEDKADPGTKALLCSIAGRRGIALEPTDVTRIPKP